MVGWLKRFLGLEKHESKEPWMSEEELNHYLFDRDRRSAETEAPLAEIVKFPVRHAVFSPGEELRAVA